MGVAAFSVISVFIYDRNNNDKANFILPLVVAFCLYLILFCLLSTGLLLLGIFDSLLAMSLSTAFSLWCFCMFWGMGAEKIKTFQLINREILLVASFVIIMLPFVADRYEFIELTGDAGVYSVSAIHIAREGKLVAKIDVRDKLSTSLRETFDKNNYLWIDQSLKRGSYVPGTYLVPGKESEYYYQFYPVWPVVMAGWGDIFGTKNEHYVMVILYISSLIFFYYILRNLGVDELYSMMSLILFGSSPLLIYFSKYPTSEIFLLFLILFIPYLLFQRNIFASIFSGFALTLFCLSHISAYMYTPLLLLLIPYAYKSKSIHMTIFLIISWMGFLCSIPYGYIVSRQYFIEVYSITFSALGFENYTFAVLAVISLAIIGLAFSAYCYLSLKHDQPFRLMTYINTIEQAHGLLAVRVWIFLIFLYTIYMGYIIGWTTQMIPEQVSQWNSWSARIGYVNKGLSSLLHLNIFSIVLGTSLVALPTILVVLLCKPEIVRRNDNIRYSIYVILFVWSLYTFLRPDTPNNYYASRYYLPILFPAAWGCFALVLFDLKKTLLIAPVVVAALFFNLRHDISLYRKPVFQGTFHVSEEILKYTGQNAIIFLYVDGYSNFLLRQMLTYLGQAKVISLGTFRSDSENINVLRETIMRYMKELEFEHAYVVSLSRSLCEYSCDAVHFKRIWHPWTIWYPTWINEQRYTYFISRQTLR